MSRFDDRRPREEYPAAPASRAVETLPRERIAALQEERLLALIRRGWERIPFYRRRWQSEGIDASDIRRLDDLARLPIVSKKDLEADLETHPPFGSYQGDFRAVRVQSSSGSTGRPKPFLQTQNDWEVIANLWSRRFHAQGVKSGDIMQFVFTYSLFIAGFTGTEGAMRLGALVIPAGSGAVTPSERQVELLQKWNVTVLAGTPSYCLHLADVAERAGLNPRQDFKLRLSTHTAEPLSETGRRAIEQRWGVDAYDNFGSVETGAPTFECAAKSGYHINEDAYIVEVINPDTRKVVKAGEEGVVVVTSLFKEASPVIRYNLEDISSMVDEPCVCGRTFRRLMKIKGRASEMVKVRGVPFYPAAIESALGGFPGLTLEYRLVIDRVDRQDRVRVQVERRANDDSGAALREKLERALKVATGLAMEVELLAPGELTRSLKVEERVKVKRIWDRRGEPDV